MPLIIHQQCLRLFLLILCVCATGSPHADEIAQFRQLGSAGYLVTDARGEPVDTFRADEPFIPASTVKLITAFLCLQHWGEEHRFSTEFYFDESISRLWVLAGGDPFLVSEEISLIARGIADAGITWVHSIGLDVSLFMPDLIVPGATTTNNPYDAVPTALAANFNTVNLEKQGERITSAEPQTPLTAIALATGQSLTSDGKQRVNLGHNSRQSEHYFAQLLQQKLHAQGIATGDEVVWGEVPGGAPVYVHRNTRTLGDVIKGMLQYSTNFIANQLLLTLVAEQSRAPVDFEQVSTFLQRSLTNHFGWDSFTLLEGAGLSPENRLTARHLVDVVRRFNDWRHLLPEINPGVVAKTGTLTSVKSLAGYAQGSDGDWNAFAILVNEPVPRELPTLLINSFVK